MSRLVVPLQLTISQMFPAEAKVIRECREQDRDPDLPADEQQWCLFDAEGEDLLGRFATREEAEEAEERAAQFREESKQEEEDEEPTPDDEEEEEEEEGGKNTKSLFGDLLRHAMTERSASIGDVASACSASASTVRKWLSGSIGKPGHRIRPSDDQVAVLSEMLDLPKKLLRRLLPAQKSRYSRPEIKQAEPLVIVEGHASVFDILDLGGDIVRPGAFARTIAETGGEIPLFWEHSHTLEGKGDSMPLGKTTLLEEDSRGLFFRGELANTSKSRDLAALMDVFGLRSSIGFDIPPGGQKVDDGVRELLDLDLMEISIVTWPMNPAATARLVNISDESEQFSAEVERLAAIAEG
jgi:HK97 family phage prohead protease